MGTAMQTDRGNRALAPQPGAAPQRAFSKSRRAFSRAALHAGHLINLWAWSVAERRRK